MDLTIKEVQEMIAAANCPPPKPPKKTPQEQADERSSIAYNRVRGI